MATELAAANLNPDSQLLLDNSLLKVPLELLRKTHKSAQRNVERERDTLLRDLKAAAGKADTSSPQAKAHTLASIDAMIHRMETLKRKLSALHAEEEQLHKQSRARLEHAKQLHSIPSTADVAFENWSSQRLNRLLVDYLLRNGYEQSARLLAQSNGIEDLVDIGEFVAARRIESSLLAHKTNECLSWCAENKASLKKMSSNLEVELRMQEYIELLRTQDPANMAKATRHARKHLSPQGDAASTRRAAGLLAYRPHTPVQPYRDMYAARRWTDLAALFMKTHHELLGLPLAPPLYVALAAGLSALKTPMCHSSHVSPSAAVSVSRPATAQDPGSQPAATALGQSVCPICSTELNALARAVPYAHQTKSMVDGDLVVLPNGRAYGREKLMAFQAKVAGGGGRQTAAEGDGGDAGDEDGMEGVEVSEVRDPADPEAVYGVDRLKKVYIS